MSCLVQPLAPRASGAPGPLAGWCLPSSPYCFSTGVSGTLRQCRLKAFPCNSGCKECASVRLSQVPAIQSSTPCGWTKVMIEWILTDDVTALSVLQKSGLLGDDPNGQSQTKDSYRWDAIASLTGTSLCAYAIEPPCTERHARWCERPARKLTS